MIVDDLDLKVCAKTLVFPAVTVNRCIRDNIN